MLDCWYKIKLFKHKKDGKSMLIGILEDKAVGLSYLSHQMKEEEEDP